MFYPLGGCETQPLISMTNVTLSNIRQYGTILPWPGIVRCNETAPCTGFVFDNVHSTGFWSILGFNYITENIIGTVTNSKPAPVFGEVGTLSKNTLENNFSPMITEKLRNIAWEYFTSLYRRYFEKRDHKSQEGKHHKRHHGNHDHPHKGEDSKHYHI